MLQRRKGKIYVKGDSVAYTIKPIDFSIGVLSPQDVLTNTSPRGVQLRAVVPKKVVKGTSVSGNPLEVADGVYDIIIGTHVYKHLGIYDQLRQELRQQLKKFLTEATTISRTSPWQDADLVYTIKYMSLGSWFCLDTFTYDTIDAEFMRIASDFDFPRLYGMLVEDAVIAKQEAVCLHLGALRYALLYFRDIFQDADNVKFYDELYDIDNLSRTLFRYGQDLAALHGMFITLTRKDYGCPCDVVVTGTVLKAADFPTGVDSIEILSLPREGTLTYNSAAVTVGQLLPLTKDITYAPNSWTRVDMFRWRGWRQADPFILRSAQSIGSAAAYIKTDRS